MSEPSSYTYKVTDEQIATLKKVLEEQGFEFREVPYAHFGAQKLKLTVNAYQSGKLLLQGKGAKEFIEFTLEPLVLGEAKLGYDEVLNPEMFEPHVGIDESGKGDFFGPLVIAGAYTDRELTKTLAAMGVKDSKQITSDKKALDLAEEIKKVLAGRWNVIAINPAKYNELYGKFKNLNRLLAWGHATVIENLLGIVPDCPRALSDQFANPALIQRALKERGQKIVLQQRTKAESDIAVAAASILARAEFLIRLQKLGEGVKTTLPKGASAQVKAVATKLGAELGAAGLRSVAKEHFRTFNEVLGLPPLPGKDKPFIFRRPTGTA
jgi:ribonuclease HIII